MSNDGTPSARYRSLAQECIETANAFPPGKERNVLLEMAEVWQRLADQYANATPPFQSGATSAARASARSGCADSSARVRRVRRVANVNTSARVEPAAAWSSWLTKLAPPRFVESL